MMNIGERITELRKEQNMTQEAFAELFFVTRQTVSNWENEKSYPDLQTLVKMSEKFGVTLDSMLKEDERAVNRFDKERKHAKYAKWCLAVLGSMLGILLILFGTYTALWYHTKQRMEEKFNEGIKQYGFALEESQWGGCNYAKKVDENTTFWVEPFLMAEWGSFYLGAWNQYVVCRIQQEDRLLEMEIHADEWIDTGIAVYDKNGKHDLTYVESQGLLSQDKGLEEVKKQGEEISEALFEPYVWKLGSGWNHKKVDSGKADAVPETDLTQEGNGNIDNENETEEPQTYEPLKEGDAVPDFTAELVGGGTFTLSEQKGKVVLLNFWATWCGPCVGEMPAFERLKEDYGDEVAILLVDCMEDKETVDKFMQKEGYTFPVAYDAEGKVSMKYPTDGIPYTLVINKDGIVRYIYLGAVDADTQYQEYKSAIEAALAEGENQ